MVNGHFFTIVYHLKPQLRIYEDTAYFAENLKHYSKIIFKCVNSTVEPIFNEKVAEK